MYSNKKAASLGVKQPFFDAKDLVNLFLIF